MKTELLIESFFGHICYGSLELLLLSGVYGHMSMLLCEKASEAYTVVSFELLPY